MQYINANGTVVSMNFIDSPATPCMTDSVWESRDGYAFPGQLRDKHSTRFADIQYVHGCHALLSGCFMGDEGCFMLEEG